ncbi:hypothetical protein AB0H43_10520 [Hamadaea sp. NPDC050747]|uniref:hypothetical protein n=1 Tax=Hamadaea sp. NPDC050747 TaxID=3155789 RepID=UPI0033F82DD9
MAASTSMTPEQRSQRARLAALARWSREDPKPSGLRANAGLRAKFTREVEAEYPGLPPAELARRAEVRFREHMVRLALASSKARGARKANGESP